MVVVETGPFSVEKPCYATPEEIGAGLSRVDGPTPAQFSGKKTGCGWHEDN
jgi:hypothetical protein